MKKLLILVDVIKGFIEEGNLHDKGIRSIIPHCLNHIENYISKTWDIIAFCDAHQEDSKEFLAYPLHCLSGSSESDLVDEIALYQDKLKVIPKNSTNGFFAPGFQAVLANLSDYNEVLIVGCCSDICVLQFAVSLKAYINENNYDTKIVVDSKACDTFSIEGHKREDYNSLAFNLMLSAGIEVL